LNIYTRNAKSGTQLVFSLVLVFSLCACQKTPTVENSNTSIQPIETTKTYETTPAISTSTFENQSLNLPLEWSEYEISPNDVRYRIEGFHFQRFKLEYPTIFHLVDINKGTNPFFRPDYSEVRFLYNPEYSRLPGGEIRISIYKPGVWNYNTINDLVEDFGMGIIQYDRVESSITVDGIQAILVTYYDRDLTTQGETISNTLCKYAAFEYQGDFWQILLFATYKTQEPPEMDLYFLHMIKTFHFVN
jgi:hypothetical protein